MAVGSRRVTMDERREMLARHVALAVKHGARVESQTDFQAVVVFGRPVNHPLHLILTLLTAGLWALAWIIEARGGGERRLAITVDADGDVEEIEGP